MSSPLDGLKLDDASKVRASRCKTFVLEAHTQIARPERLYGARTSKSPAAELGQQVH